MADVLSILFFGGIAIFFGYRLYTLLGRSEGHMEAPQAPEKKRNTLPEQGDRPHLRPAFDGPAAAGLEAIANVDSRFDPASFVEGARSAYQMIVTAFAAGDRATLQGLLAENVLKRYVKAIDDREARDESVKTEIDAIRAADITEAELFQGKARVKVRFDADIATETRDSTGKVVAGDLAQVNSVKEYWTFERDTSSADPNWVLASVAIA